MQKQTGSGHRNNPLILRRPLAQATQELTTSNATDSRILDLCRARKDVSLTQPPAVARYVGNVINGSKRVNLETEQRLQYWCELLAHAMTVS